MEVEDEKTSVISQAWDGLASFVQGFLSEPQPRSPPMKSANEQTFTPLDRVMKYLHIFVQLRKTTK